MAVHVRAMLQTVSDVARPALASSVHGRFRGEPSWSPHDRGRSASLVGLEVEMKKAILAAAALLTALAPALSEAQDRPEHGGDSRPAQSRPAPAPRAGAPAQPGAYRGGEAAGRGAPVAPPAGAYRAPYAQGGPGPGAYHAYPGQGAPAVRGAGGYGAAAPRVGARAFTYNGRQFFRYRAGPYYFPQGYEGWAGHQWRAGEWLPAVFISSAFFIGDWYDFGLWNPGYGYQWIRVGADAVLVNLADGQVVDVVPGVYYY